MVYFNYIIYHDTNNIQNIKNQHNSKIVNLLVNHNPLTKLKFIKQNFSSLVWLFGLNAIFISSTAAPLA